MPRPPKQKPKIGQWLLDFDLFGSKEGYFGSVECNFGQFRVSLVDFNILKAWKLGHVPSLSGNLVPVWENSQLDLQGVVQSETNTQPDTCRSFLVFASL